METVKLKTGQISMTKNPPLWLVLLLRTAADEGYINNEKATTVINAWFQATKEVPLNVPIEVWLLMQVGPEQGKDLIMMFNEHMIRCLVCDSQFTPLNQKPISLSCPTCSGTMLERSGLVIPLNPINHKLV